MLPVLFFWQSYISSEKFSFNTIAQIKIPNIPHTLAEIPFHCSSSSACLQSLHIFSIPHFSWVRLYCTNADQIMVCHSSVTSKNCSALFQRTGNADFTDMYHWTTRHTKMCFWRQSLHNLYLSFSPYAIICVSRYYSSFFITSSSNAEQTW